MRRQPHTLRGIGVALLVAALFPATAGAGGLFERQGRPPPAALERVHRLPTGEGYRSSPTTGFAVFKLGTYDVRGPASRGTFVGLRAGSVYAGRLTLAVNLDFHRRSFIEEAVIAEEVDAHGHVVRTTVTTLETSSNLTPIGVSMGLRLPGGGALTPFLGAGIAYEVLFNRLRDHEEGIEDTNIYGGPGWQLFGGLLAPIAPGAQLLGEIWFNDAVVRRDVERHVAGLPVRESIDVSGLGARIGVEVTFP